MKYPYSLFIVIETSEILFLSFEKTLEGLKWLSFGCSLIVAIRLTDIVRKSKYLVMSKMDGQVRICTVKVGCWRLSESEIHGTNVWNEQVMIRPSLNTQSRPSSKLGGHEKRLDEPNSIWLVISNKIDIILQVDGQGRMWAVKYPN